MDALPVYLSMQEIQKEMDRYYAVHGACCTFTDAVETLYHTGAYHQTRHGKPDYAKWDVRNKKRLWDIYEKQELEVVSILKNPDLFAKFVNEDYFGFGARDVIPNLHVHHELSFAHAHDYFEINYVLEGALDVRIGAEEMKMLSGDLCIIAPNTKHEVRALDDAVAAVIAIRKSTFQKAFFSVFHSENVLSDFFRNSLYSSRYRYLFFTVLPKEEICELIRHIFMEAYSNERGANEIACSYLSIFFGMVLRNYSATYLRNDRERSVISQMSAVLIYIEGNYKNLTLGKLSEFFGYDSAYLGRQIFKATGKHYHEIVENLKMQEACRLLQYTDKKIDEIAEVTGFNSLQHFSRSFRAWKGCSATDYRRQSRSEQEKEGI